MLVLHFQSSMKWARALENRIKMNKLINKLKCLKYRQNLFRNEYVREVTKIITKIITEEICKKIISETDLNKIQEANKVRLCFLLTGISRSFLFNFKGFLLKFIFFLLHSLQKFC